MIEILKLLFEKLTKFFWQSIFLTSISLWCFDKYTPSIFSFKLFETKSGIAQAISTVLILLSAFYLIMSFMEKIYSLISNAIYHYKKRRSYEMNKYQKAIQFIEDLFNKDRPCPIVNYLNEFPYRFFLLRIYRKKLKKFKSDKIFNDLKQEAMERQKCAKEHECYYSILSKQQCIELQNFYQSINLLDFDGSYYKVNKLILNKLEEVDHRGMFEEKYLSQERRG